MYNKQTSMSDFKVIKPIYGLEIGDIIKYNKVEDKYEFSSDSTDTYEDGQELRIRFDLKINKADIERLAKDGYLKADSKLSEPILVRPSILKVYEVLEPGVVEIDGVTTFGNTGDYLLVKSNGKIVRANQQELFKFFHIV